MQFHPSGSFDTIAAMLHPLQHGQHRILLAGAGVFLSFLCSFKAYAATAPIAHWRFDEGTGTSVYSNPRTATGTFMTPNPTWSTDVPSVSFTNPYSLNFTSTGDGVQFAWPSSLNFSGTEERSFSFWYKPTGDGEIASGNFDRIMSWSGDAFEIAGTYGDVAVHRLAFYDGSWRDTGYNLSVGTWHNITFTYDGTNVKLFVSGVEKFSGSSAGRDINGTMYIGVRHTGDEGINGRIDDVRIYDYALTESQINNIVAGSDDPDAAPAPTLSGALVPADNATNINGSANLVMRFNRAVIAGTGSIVIKKSSDDSTVETIAASGSRISGTGSSTITINPVTTLSDSTSYYVIVQPNAFKTASGAYFAGLTGTGSWNFTTGDFSGPSVSARSPADDATDVSTAADLVLTFDETTRAGTGTLTIKLSSDDSTVETITVSGALLSGNGSTQLTLNPSTTLSAGTSYYVVWSANAFKDASGNHTAAITASTTWNFTTAAAASSSSSSSSSSSAAQGGGGGRRGSPGRGGDAPVRRTSAHTPDDATAAGVEDVYETNGVVSDAPNSNVSVTGDDSRVIVFRDVWTDDWFGQHVRRLAELKIFEGYKDMNGNPLGLYGPADPITLGQLAKVCTVIVGQSVIGMTTGERWADAYLDAANAMSLSVFNRRINPQSAASRGAVIQSLMEALRIPTDGYDITYDDVSPLSPFADAIAAATALGIISGDDGTNRFRPEDPINRAEAAKMIVNALSVK